MDKSQTYSEQRLKVPILFASYRFCHYRICPKPLLQSKPSTAKTTRSMQIARRLKSLEVQNIEVVNVDPGFYAKLEILSCFPYVPFQLLSIYCEADNLVYS